MMLMRPTLMFALVIFAGAEPGTAQISADMMPLHTPRGAPDLQGYWTNASLTTMERPQAADKLVVSEEEAARLVRRNVYNATAQQEAYPSMLDAAASQRLLADKNTSRAYNSFWLQPGASLARIKGGYRSSWIISPDDGRIPYQSEVRPAAAAPVYDGPEARPPSERCLMSFTGAAGPVMNNGIYNNAYQIVQSPDSVMILTEMIHEARIIPIGRDHGPKAIPKWGGDSVGRYEGETLVVETTNPHPKQRSYIGPSGKVTERFTRWSADEILYEFTVDDSTLYKAPWKGEMILSSTPQPVLEYACHEGNYALPSVLAGARVLERQGRKQPPIQQPYYSLDVSEGQ